MNQSKIYIYGRHAVEEALINAPHIVRKISLARQMDDKKLRDLIKKSGIETEHLDERRATSQVEGGAAHQGVIALIATNSLAVPFEKYIETLAPTPETSFVFLHEVQDPHNVGAAIRSAVAFGASAVFMPTHKQAPISGAVIKASAGMAFRIPLVSVTNIQQAISQLKSKGVVVYGLAAQSKHSITTEQFESPSLFIVGNEAKGIAPVVRELCDKVLSIPISNKAESLNVAASGAVALYAWSTKHPQAFK